MTSALGSHRFNPQTGLWELVTLENAAGVEMSLPAVEALRGVGADGPGTAPPDPATPPPSEPVSPAEWWEPAPDDLIGPWGWAPPIPPIPPTIIESPDGLIIIGGPVRSELEGGDGNDLIIAGALANPPSDEIFSQCGSGPYDFGGDRLRGGLGQDTLIGNDLSNELNGGAGADVMIGGGGTDVYVVDDTGDRVIEVNQGGYDWVRSSVSYILADNVEGLTLTYGAGDINGAGNILNNFLIGNEGRNILSGGAGDDFLVGFSGDTLIGGEGQDVFYVSEQGNSVIADFQVGVDKLAGAFDFPAMRQDGADTFITWGQGEIRLIGVDMRLVVAQDVWTGHDFVLAPLFY